MVVLGLGTNLGDRLAALRAAYSLLKQLPKTKVLQTSPVYQSDALVTPNAPPDWHKPYLNCAVRCETSLSPFELLKCTKEIEIKLGRKPAADWAPRPIDVDILAWDERILRDEILHIPHEHLASRPFALWPLADVAPSWVSPVDNLAALTACEQVSQWGSRFSGAAPFHTQQIPHRIDTPSIMGILNVSPDSFSEQDKCSSPTLAIDAAVQMAKCGADIIDIGAISTRPSAQAVTEQEEWARLAPVLSQTVQQCTALPLPAKISVDTWHFKTAEKALTAGAHIINDQSGLSNFDVLKLMLSTGCQVVCMHNLGLPANADKIMTSPITVISEVQKWAEAKLELMVQNQIPLSQLILDVGIGFGKSANASLALLQHIEQFKAMGVPLLIGHSRKSFLNLFTNHPAKDRDLESHLIALQIMQHVDYFRVHDVDGLARSFKVAANFA